MYKHLKQIKEPFYIYFDFCNEFELDEADKLLKNVCPKDISLKKYFNDNTNEFKDAKKNYIIVQDDYKHQKKWGFITENDFSEDTEVFEISYSYQDLHTLIKKLIKNV